MAVIMKTPRCQSLALLVLLCRASRLASAWQVDVPPERAALSGAWTVNKDLTDQPQMPERLPTNGKKVRLTIDDMDVETRARWDKARLVKIENWRMPQPQTVRRVYDGAAR
jgi:hypothetical protein